MKKFNFKLLTLLLLAAALVGCLKDDVKMVTADVDSITIQAEAELITYASDIIADQYIVIYKTSADATKQLSEAPTYTERQSVMKDAARKTLAKSQIAFDKVEHVYGTVVKGFSAKLTGEELSRLRKDQDIDYIEQDQLITVAMGGPPGGGGGGGGDPVQTTPWGITRVGGGLDGSGLRAWIIDSGVDLDHPDLNVNTTLSQSFLSGNQSTNPDDQHGHGTHVAGTVAAVDNSIGVIGVAAGAEVVSVRVLDRRGSGSNSGVIAGVNYVGANAGSNDAANMSLGGGVSTTLDNAVINASSACPFALAAGNESDDANNHSPARANSSNIKTVSSMAQGDNWSYFSNYGNPPVDFCAPGSSIPSLWKDGGYNTISGTSMASPHVCGLLLLGNVNSDGTVNGDPDGNPDPIAHH